jgi:membrane fusion protein (multidrug efflux system)
LDDSAERELVAQLKAEAENAVRVDAAEAQLNQKKLDLRKTELAHDKEAATIMELEHARLEVLIAELSLKLAKFQHEQDQRKYNEARLRVERMLMKSPLAGLVERVLLEDGESADALEKVIRIVRINPLWIDAPVPSALAAGLKVGESAKVAFSNDGGTVVGKITFISAVADAASDTLIVRVEVANESLRPAGERVELTFVDGVDKPRPEPTAAVDADKDGARN